MIDKIDKHFPVIAFTLGYVLGALVQSWGSDPMLQRNFPCQEDEVLMFSSAEPDKDRLACVHIEVLP